ncbi:TPA: helix-turn-helix domain-containing protein [Candidatus Bipolaricaulota bacterium]|nr:helix-turn-helix domain-containing protein [Candidatus Bipolaricaulota bacterium]
MDRGEFGRRLRELRRERGLGLRELARRAGIDHTRLSKIERGLRPPPEPVLILKLAQALEVEPLPLARLGGLPDGLLASVEREENLLKGRIVKSSGGLALVEVGDTRLEVVTEIGKGEVIVGIGPEEITLHLDKPPRSSARNSLPGVIKEILSYRNYYYVVIDCGDFQLKAAVTARSLAELGLRPGERVLASFKATAARVLEDKG